MLTIVFRISGVLGVWREASPPAGAFRPHLSFNLLVCSLLLVLGHGCEGAGLPQKDVELQEKYENFFQLVDRFLWDSEESEGRMYRRGRSSLSSP